MKNNKTYQIIYSFWGKRFQEKLRMRFWFWMKMNKNEKVKEEALQDIWEMSPSVVNDNTWKNLDQLKKHIAETEKIYPMQKHPIHIFRKYAAIILLAICSSVSGIWIYSLLKKDTQPTFTECFVPYGEQKEITLPDGSSVYLNSGSVLVYPENFQGKERSVYLTGEARFQVTKNQQSFIVHTDQLDIEVLGTTFNVQAYPDREQTVATLEEGSIQINTRDNHNEKHILKPNEQFIFSRTGQTMAVHQVNAPEYSSWKDGYLRFENSRFEEIVFTLERKYSVKIHYDQKKFMGRSYQLTFQPDESLDEALHIMSQLIKDFNYKRIDNTIFIN